MDSLLTFLFCCKRTWDIKSPFTKTILIILASLAGLILFYFMTIGFGYFWYTVIWKLDGASGCYPNEIEKFKENNTDLNLKCDYNPQNATRCSRASNRSFYVDCAGIGFVITLGLLVAIPLVGFLLFAIFGGAYLLIKAIIEQCVQNYQAAKQDVKQLDMDKISSNDGMVELDESISLKD
jgi:hypothetical protein